MALKLKLSPTRVNDTQCRVTGGCIGSPSRQHAAPFIYHLLRPFPSTRFVREIERRLLALSSSSIPRRCSKPAIPVRGTPGQARPSLRATLTLGSLHCLHAHTAVLIFVRLGSNMSKTNVTNSVSVGLAVQTDWDNRHFSNSLSLNVRRLFEFLLQFESATRTKLATLNEKLTVLERQLEYLEAQFNTASVTGAL